VAIKDPEITATRPSSLEVGFGNVHDDRHAIFIIVFDESVEGIDCVSFDGAVRALDELDSINFRYI
jgi:hypothetical protein